MSVFASVSQNDRLGLFSMDLHPKVLFMNFLSSDPMAVLRAVRSLEHAQVAVPEDFTLPNGSDVRRIGVPEPGVVHPAHVPWIADCLGMSVELVQQTLDSHSEDGGVRSLAKGLVEAVVPQSSRLRELGVVPTELILRYVPLAPGDERPNTRPPESSVVLSSVNAELEMFNRKCRSLDRLVALGAPAIIVESRGSELQHDFLSLLHVLRGLGPVFEQPYEHPTPRSLVIPPPRCNGWTSAPSRPSQVAVDRSTAVVRFPTSVARIDLESGAFSTHPLGDAGLVALIEGCAVFTHGAHLVLFDTRKNRFSLETHVLPHRVVVGACCGVSILDTHTGKVATMPGPLASSAHGVAVSGCGKYGWLELHPEVDDVGVFSIDQLERVHNPWPHSALGRPGAKSDLGEGHDGTVRAIARTTDGSFRFLYGELLFQGQRVHRLPSTPIAAGFDATGERLITLDATELRVHQLSSSAQPSVEAKWSLQPLEEHLSPGHLPLDETGLEFGALMGVAGTVGALAGSSAVELEERLYLADDSSRTAIERIIETARALSLPTNLRAVTT